MRPSFEYMTYLQYTNKALEKEVESLRSGKAFVKLRDDYHKMLDERDRLIRELRHELAELRTQMVKNRNHWLEVAEDVRKEGEKEAARLSRKLKQEEQRNLDLERQLAAAKEKIRSQRDELYSVKTELAKEKGKNQKLMAQFNRDHENSSIPSSRSANRKKIVNSREKTGRKPGGQPGHRGHRRKKQEPTSAPVLLAPPREVLDDPDFKKTSKTIIKQLVNIRMLLEVEEYHADVYYNSKTGERRHAEFPEGVVDDVNYGGSIKAFLFLLNNECCVSIDKSRRFLSDLTGGKLNISKGMISKLSREFAEKSEDQHKAAFADLLLTPVMHTDCTNGKVNGKNVYVFVCAAPDGKALYFAREKKGHQGIEGTPVEDYQGILVHDHESTFYKYGTDHQECLAHVLRYLKDSMQNEPERTWNRDMRSLVQEMIHYHNGLEPGTECPPEKRADFESRYKKILQTAREEYEYEPASDYYKDGYNLYLRMEKYMHNHLLFLADHRVPATNNEAERLLRGYKRKQQQAMSFRSFESLDYLCQCMSMLVMMRRKENANIFDRVSQIFG